MLNFLNNLGPTELIILAILLIVFFGSKKIVDLGKQAGEATKEFKKAKKELVGAVSELKSDNPDTNSDSGEGVQR